MKKTLISSVLVLSGLIGTFSMAQEFVIPDPVAVIDGKPLTKEEFTTAILQMGADNLDFITTTHDLNGLVTEYALQEKLVDRAEKEKLNQTPEFKSAIKQLERTALAQAYIKKIIDETKVTDEEVKAEYDKQIKALDKTEYKAAHILVENEQEAKDIIAKLHDKKKSQSFADAAKEYSIDPGSKENGGELGWFRAQVMVPEFGAALEKMKADEISETPVKSQFGYHIINLEEVRETPVVTLDEVKDRLKEAIVAQKVGERLEAVKEKIKIEFKAQ